MSAMINFHAEDKSVTEVLFGTRKFRIPRYQRSYAWDADQITDFWNDLIGDEDAYFLGSWIFNYEQAEETGYIEIIDGQQRILTITILSAVLRDIASSIDEDTANRIQRQDIAFEDRSGEQAFRVLPGDSTEPFFRTNIQLEDGKMNSSSPSTQEEKRIKKNYEFLYDRVNSEISKYDAKEDSLKALEEIRNRVAKLIVIEIQIQNEEEAYEIFETTNARGIELSVADLLKNLIFKKIPETEIRDYAKELWSETTENILATDSELKRFLRYFWISKYSFVNDKKLFREIKREITDWKELLEDIWYASNWYNKLVAGGEDDFDELMHSERVFKSIHSIRLMNVSQCYVLFLCLLRNYDRLGTDPVRIFELIEKFTFQYSVVCKLPSNRIEHIYSRYALEIEGALNLTSEKRRLKKVNSILSQLENELSDVSPSEDFFDEMFQELRYRNSEKSRMLNKYILSEIDAHLSKSEEQLVNFGVVNIEHILPQTPHEDWGISKSEIKRFVNNLGNLTLLSKRLNSKVQNRVIKEKLPSYSKSTLPITMDLVRELKGRKGGWSEIEIAQRQSRFADMAYKDIWAF